MAALATAGLVLGPPAPKVRAQAAEPRAGLDLAQAIQTTIVASPEIRLAEQEAEASRGDLVAASEPFDVRMTSEGAAIRAHSVAPGTQQDTIQSDLSYSLGAERLFRNGVNVRSALVLTRRGYAAVPGSDTANHVDVGAALTLPLLQDRGGALSVAGERVAGYAYGASRFELQHAIALRVLSAAVAYWDYLAAQRRLEVYASSEARAERTVEETRVLVEADERTAADLVQLRGNLASKRVSRIAAEQGVVEARQQLGLAMGVPAESVTELPPPATDFPVLAADPAAPVDMRALLEAAYARRADLAAAEQDVRSAQAAVDASRSELKPRLDIVVETGYRAAETGLGFRNFFAPIYREQPRLDGSLKLSAQLPGANTGARGRLLRSTSAHEQQRIRQQDLRRRVAAGVAVAVEALVRGEAGMRESDEAVRLFQSGVDAEQRKFQVGMSTLFDMIQAQDALTGALLGRIQSQRNYAVAVATLSFQSGRLVDGEPGRPIVAQERLLTPLR